jgi:tRNA threonylcarbamoyladenosine modification (KEOPS) complex  Pcc1 subunit
VDSVRVDICYRPLRIGWAIRAGDFVAFRSAVRSSFALWGGRFNPIIVVDQEELAQNLVDLFRLDVIIPVGDSEIVQAFPKRFPYLIKPFFDDRVFADYGEYGARSQVLDIYNALIHLQKKPEWEAVKKKGVCMYSWAPEDPLADVFLMHFGDYPSADEIHINYRGILEEAAEATEIKIEATGKLSSDLLDHPSISFVSRCGLHRHYSVPAGWDTPGFYSGDAGDLDDLVCYWNLRAADIPLLFVDASHLERYGEAVEFWDKTMRDTVSHRRHEFDRKVAVWVRRERLHEEKIPESLGEVLKPFGKKEFTLCPVSADSLNGLNLRPPMMHFGEVSTLGVVSTEYGKTKISFALDNKPFCGEPGFHSQHLIASLSFIGGLYGDEKHMLIPPFVPELNEFYARTLHFEYNKVRSESERIGLVIDAADSSSFIYALPVPDLFEKVFDLSGFSSKLSEGGLVARQLIAQLGGVDGARAFKIPGVRRLLKTHGPRAPFTKKSALELIGSQDPESPDTTFKDYENLYIEPRPHGTKLDPEAVFTYLVEKGLFRIGAELKCPHCRLDSWTALDALKQHMICELCGQEFDATRQLVQGAWRYRRSGVLGGEKNAQGAVPVVLTLQQFQLNMSSLRAAVYSPSLDLEPKGAPDVPKCEVDFAWLIPQPYPEKTVVVIGECKDRGSKKGGKEGGTIDEKDIDNLRRVADALPRKRFNTFIVLAKLCSFTENEIALAKTLNEKHRNRAILLTARELEPLHFYERTRLEFKNIREYAHNPEDLARNTAAMYFSEKALVTPSQPDAASQGTSITAASAPTLAFPPRQAGQDSK